MGSLPHMRVSWDVLWWLFFLLNVPIKINNSGDLFRHVGGSPQRYTMAQISLIYWIDLCKMEICWRLDLFVCGFCKLGLLFSKRVYTTNYAPICASMPSYLSYTTLKATTLLKKGYQPNEQKYNSFKKGFPCLPNRFQMTSLSYRGGH